MGSNRLMAIGSAAVIGVYAAGFFKTKAAADRFAADSNVRRPPPPSEPVASADRTVERVTPPAADPRGTRVGAGATAALPPMPALVRADDHVPGKPVSSPAAAEPATIQATVANALPSITAAAADSVPVVAPVVTSPEVVTPPPPPPAPPPAPVPAPVQVAAPQPIATKRAEPDPPARVQAAPWKDGTYYGWGKSRHGDIQAVVVIHGGRITNALVAQCLTQYSCSWIAALPPQVVGRQSAEVDYVSGATQSVNAFYYAIVEALSHAK